MTGVKTRIAPAQLDASATHDVTVIVVNYNAGVLLDRCLDSIREHGAPYVTRTIVVDNASSDGSIERTAQRFDVEVIRNDTNLGFAVANNHAIRAADTELVLLLNPDAELTPGCLNALVDAMHARPKAAAIGPRLVYPDGRLQRWTAGREPGVASLTTFALGLDRVIAGARPPGGLFLGRDVDFAIAPDWVSGACLLLRGTALHDVGLFDESFFCYMEDVDLCRRLRGAGWEIWYEPAGTCVHTQGASAGAARTGVGEITDQPAETQHDDQAISNLMRYHARENGLLAHLAFRLSALTCFGTRATAHAVLAALHNDDHHHLAAQNHVRHARASFLGGPMTATDAAHHHGSGVTVQERHQHELETYNARARELWDAVPDEKLVIDVGEPPFPNRTHTDFLRYAIASLGPLEGKRILEVGCGNGSLATYLALRGADVTALDISEEMVRVTGRRARANAVEARCRALTEAIEEHEAPDHTYDLVIGNQVLHHVVLSDAMPNIRRMLAPGGRIAFCEPVLMLPEPARKLRNSGLVTRVFPLRTDSPDERSLGDDELVAIGEPFDFHSVRPFQITTRLENFVPINDRFFRLLHKFDRALLATVPGARRFCRYVVVVAGTGMPGGER